MKIRLQPPLPILSRPSLPLPSSRQFTPLRTLTTSKAHNSNSNSKPNPSHWLTHQKARIGKCIQFGLSRPQLGQCSQILDILCKEWKLLVAGREGYVSARAGVERHKVVWGEMDSMGHVNNVMYVRYAETGRVEWLCNLGLAEGERARWSELMTPKAEKGLILKSIKVDFKFPMTWPDHITVCHKLRSAPSSPTTDPSSFILDVLILSELHQRPAARCEEDIVVYDYKVGKKAPVSGFMKEGFERTWQEQEAEKRRAEARIVEVEQMVRRLEEESWAKEGAVEDMGGAKQ